MPGAIDRLIPPWESASVLSSPDSLAPGSVVKVRNRIGPLNLTWVAEHTEYQANHRFVDEIRSGPFPFWKHTHLFKALGPSRSELLDSIEYQLYGAPLANLVAPWVQSKINAMFRFRHEITEHDLACARQLFGNSQPTKRIRIGISGSSGLIGRRTVELGSVLGIQMIRLTRKESKPSDARWPAGVQSISLDSNSDRSSLDSIEALDAWIHLGGVGIADKRWSTKQKQAIRSSRIESTNRIIDLLGRLDQPPPAFVSASGIGVFGDRGDEPLDESSSTEPAATGQDFLADVAREWEGAAMKFTQLDRRVAIARFGIVLHPRAGALPNILTPFRFGFGGPIGPGTQYWPWIHIDDAANMLLFLALRSECQGAFNAVAPEARTNRQFGADVARVLHRPNLIPTPGFAVRLALGEMAQGLLLSSAKAVPSALLKQGYNFRFPTLKHALCNLLGRPKISDA